MQTIKLQYPIKVDGADVTALNMRRPKVADMLLADKLSGSDGDKEVRMFANLCEVTPETIEQLDLADYTKLQETYRAFLSSAPATRAKSA